jgi:RNA polymerase sigma-70 factor (ECF subfamily)
MTERTEDQSVQHAAPPAGEAGGPASDPFVQLADVYRSYPGLRALIMRRVRDPDVAMDILQDAAVTTLEKLRAGEIAEPRMLGGFLYRVAINHARNHLRKEYVRQGDADALELLEAPESDGGAWSLARRQWRELARSLLDELSVGRDRELLVRYYLHEEERDEICRALGLSETHFNRVIFRARTRVRELLEARGIAHADLLAIVLVSLLSASVLAYGSPQRPAVVPIAAPVGGVSG